MNASTTSETNNSTETGHSFWIYALVYGLLGPIAAFAKMGTVPLLIISVFGQTSARSLYANLKHVLRSPLFLAVSSLMAWGAVTFLWSDQMHVFSLIRLVSIIALSFFFVQAIETLNARDKSRLSTVVISASIFLLSVLLFEGFTDAALHRILRPEDAAPRDGEWVPYLQMVAARGTAFLAPLCFIVAALLARKYGPWAGYLFIALSIFAAIRLPMNASALSIALGGVVYMLVKWRPRLVTRLMYIGVACFAISAPALMSSLFTVENFKTFGLETSRAVDQRLEIWEYSSGLILEQPILGYGFDTSRDLGSRGEFIEGTNWAALPLHPHNAFIQIWLELGLIGICLSCFLLWRFWTLIDDEIDKNHDTAPSMAAFASIVTISLISFGIWQYWWIATWALVAGASKLLQSDASTS